MSAWVNVDMCTRRGKPLKVSRTFWEYQSTVSKLITRFCQSQEAPPHPPKREQNTRLLQFYSPQYSRTKLKLNRIRTVRVMANRLLSKEINLKIMNVLTNSIFSFQECMLNFIIEVLPRKF